MEREVVLWAVVLFPNGGAATVLASWFSLKEGKLLWPPKNMYLKALKEHMTAHKGWTTYANVRLLITCDSLEKAKRYEEKYVTTGCPTTDLSSEDEAGERGKRRVRPNPVYMESDGESETSCVKRRFAKPPDVHCPTVLPESSQYPSGPTPNASSASGGSHSEDVLSIHQADNGFCGSYLAELDQSMDHCNDGLPTYNSSPYHAMPLEKARNDGGASYAHGSRLADFSALGLAHLTPQHPSHPLQLQKTPRGRLYGEESSRVLKDIAAMRTTKMLTELCMEVKQISRDINFIKTELAKLNIHGAGPESQEDNFPIMLPLTNEEKFDETEAALREEAVRRKMITRLALVGGTNSENMIRRMLSAAMTNSLACIFNWVGKGEKRAFKDTLIKDCMFAAARQFDRRLTELTFRVGVQKWLRYAPERNGGVPRKK
ncbi:uncharacterized protein LOC117554695 [Gymnodraco acuticeps]|uniref:Uncharacterized protein LOC117554695 n=1 Tax=Gymnodraco acuticeps TaxID=8218 RepID=A0A6P8WC28_GYMAC|nr:uncharacterized protein LOC117554695 [Gymnodraco acuticeps]